MRIDTTIPYTSCYCLYADVPFRFAYRHFGVATNTTSSASLGERVVHLALGALLLIPIVGAIIALAEKILLPSKVGSGDPHPEIKLDGSARIKLIEGDIDIFSLTPNEIKAYAKENAFWNILEQSKKEVAEEFSVEGFRMLVGNSEFITDRRKCKILACIIEHLPEKTAEFVENLKLFSSVATVEMEKILLAKIKKYKRSSEDSALDAKLKRVLNISIKNANEKRHEKEQAQVNPTEKKEFKHVVRQSIPKMATSSQLVKPISERMSDKNFYTLLKNPPDDIFMRKNDDFFFKLLAKYSVADDDIKSEIVHLLGLGLKNQSTTNAIFERTLLMYRAHMKNFVRILHEIDLAHIARLWRKLEGDRASFDGDSGKKFKRDREKEVLSSLSIDQLRVSFGDPKFEVFLKNNAAFVASCFSVEKLELLSKNTTPEICLHLMGDLSEDDSQFYEKLKVMCKIFGDLNSMNQVSQEVLLPKEIILKKLIKKIDDPNRKRILESLKKTGQIELRE